MIFSHPALIVSIAAVAGTTMPGTAGQRIATTTTLTTATATSAFAFSVHYHVRIASFKDETTLRV